MSLSLSVGHGRAGDLSVWLEHAGEGVLLMSNVKNQAGMSCPGEDVFAVFNDSHSTPVSESCNSGSAIAILGNLAPEDNLSTFDGHSTAGEWLLTIEDDAPNNTGQIAEWCLLMG